MKREVIECTTVLFHFTSTCPLF